MANTPINQSAKPVGGPRSCVMRCQAYTCQPTMSTAGKTAAASLGVDKTRRGNTAKNANSSGPTATLVANGTHRSAARTGGRACQKATRRIGSGE